jgi:hypothetical protein
VVITIGELQVNVIDCVAISPTAPLISVVLFTKIVVLYRGLVADVAALVCFSVSGTVVPHAACSVAFTFAAAVSLRKSKVIVLASKPFTNLCAVSPIAVTSSSSNALEIEALVQ